VQVPATGEKVPLAGALVNVNVPVGDVEPDDEVTVPVQVDAVPMKSGFGEQVMDRDVE